MTTRRDILQWLPAIVAAPHVVAAEDVVPARPATRKRLDILFLGGTGFLGPHQVRHALERG
ncbi:MAG: hypothetical protein K0R70_2547, partial [Steroidobacteraceae bacterium]|nr:hypothetical protein [Steroidobacteraceae bacterium]